MSDNVESPRHWMVRLGEGGRFAEELIADGRLGVNFVGDVDLTPFLSATSAPFHAAVDPLADQYRPGRTKGQVGLSVGNLWVATCAIDVGDVVITSLGDGQFATGVVTGGYEYAPGRPLPHRRAVDWDVRRLQRSEMSAPLARLAVIPPTVYRMEQFADEIEALRRGEGVDSVDDEATPLERTYAFVMEKQLEDFLVQNWAGTPLAAEWDIYDDRENGDYGQQLQTDTGPLDVLAISKDRSRLLVIELKRGRPSDDVVGQVLRYMGWVSDVLAEPGQTVEGLIIGSDDDLRVRRALRHVPNIEFMKYQVHFDLIGIPVSR